MNHTNHYVVMFFIMLLSGALSTMNMWADKWDDIYFSLNDAYMIFLMTGWMLFFMGLFYSSLSATVIGGLMAFTSFRAIRHQFFVTEDQFLRGMIPHHSMAILMSKRLGKKENTIQDLLDTIIKTQTKEIAFMKSRI